MAFFLLATSRDMVCGGRGVFFAKTLTIHALSSPLPVATARKASAVAALRVAMHLKETDDESISSDDFSHISKSKVSLNQSHIHKVTDEWIKNSADSAAKISTAGNSQSSASEDKSVRGSSLVPFSEEEFSEEEKEMVTLTYALIDKLASKTTTVVRGSSAVTKESEDQSLRGSRVSSTTRKKLSFKDREQMEQISALSDEWRK